MANVFDLSYMGMEPNVFILDINVEGQNYNTIIRDTQFHPLNDHCQ